MNKHTATCPNGQIVKRNSKARRYTHVAVCKNNQGEWKVLGWSSTAELARTNVRSLMTRVENLIRFNSYTGYWGDKPECLILEANVV